MKEIMAIKARQDLQEKNSSPNRSDSQDWHHPNYPFDYDTVLIFLIYKSLPLLKRNKHSIIHSLIHSLIHPFIQTCISKILQRYLEATIYLLISALK